MLLALEFPPLSRLVEWKSFFLSGTPLAVNKVVLVMWLAAVLTFLFFWVAGRRGSLVPTGLQNMAESVVDFIHNGVILQSMGPEGLFWAPFLTTVFCFIFLGNIFEVIPFIQMPANARMAIPFFLAVVVWVSYNTVGIRKHGPWGYLKSIIAPPGVPAGLLPLFALINFVSDIFVRPFALAVRLFANMLAGHLLLATFAVLSAALLRSTIIGAAVPGALLVALTGFEVLVSVLQAFIFTILTAVFIGLAQQTEH
ncbi:MAG TPA: F0F1 ATP synthase subunit A [Acidimicrobiales bacterium]|nr:F0F1 ATP synthase subunit A [Acidimicrobiales bacterium]